MFKPPPHLAFFPLKPYPDEFILRIDPNPGADLVVQAKKPGAQTTRTVDLSLIFSEELGDLPEPYERLLGDALQGEASLFTREDSVEETWRIVQPLTRFPAARRTYAQGRRRRPVRTSCWRGYPGWREPWLHSHSDALDRPPLGRPATPPLDGRHWPVATSQPMVPALEPLISRRRTFPPWH